MDFKYDFMDTIHSIIGQLQFSMNWLLGKETT